LLLLELVVATAKTENPGVLKEIVTLELVVETTLAPRSVNAPLLNRATVNWLAELPPGMADREIVRLTVTLPDAGSGPLICVAAATWSTFETSDRSFDSLLVSGSSFVWLTDTSPLTALGYLKSALLILAPGVKESEADVPPDIELLLNAVG
jgi:hypothetical protein